MAFEPPLQRTPTGDRTKALLVGGCEKEKASVVWSAKRPIRCSRQIPRIRGASS